MRGGWVGVFHMITSFTKDPFYTANESYFVSREGEGALAQVNIEVGQGKGRKDGFDVGLAR